MKRAIAAASRTRANSHTRTAVSFKRPSAPALSRRATDARTPILDVTGSTPIGTCPAVPGPRVSGPRVTGPGVAGPGVAGPRIAGPRVARPGVASPGIAGPGVARPGVAGPRVAVEHSAHPGGVRRLGARHCG